MKKIGKKAQIIILTTILITIFIAFIVINGNTYTIKIDISNENINIENIKVEIDDENIIKCIDKKIENGILKVKIESESEGKTFIQIKNSEGEISKLFSIYVHKFGIITFNEYMGDCNGSIIIPISITIWLLYILFLLFTSYRQNTKINMYQYKNIAYLGIIVFIGVTIWVQISSIFHYNGLINTIDGLLKMFSFSFILLPIAFIVSILVILSNISLIRKEGFNLKNILGILLGAFLCFTTLLPEFMYKMLYSATWIDIHNQNGYGLYIYNFVETFIFLSITYIECILIGTIIMGVKSAKHIPKFDKDAIIILGCKIKKDGTLTNLLKSRVDRALDFAKMQKEKANKDIIFVPSGGKGNDESISEAQAMKNYLLEKGINENNILVEDKSKNTYENIKFSNSLIKEKIKNAKIAFSTTNYHVFRAGNIASEQNLNYEGIGAKTKIYFWINAFIREFIATLYTERKKHFIIILSIIINVILAIIITYINNNI